MKIGFIGLGKMGIPIAARLLAAGHELGVYNRTPGKAGDLVARGAKQVAGPAEAAAFGEIVVTMLENDKALAAMIDGGILSGLAKGGIHVAMGTHSVAYVAQMTEQHAEAGLRFVSAPVLGRPPAAEAGQLGILAAGAADAVSACQPLFEAIGRRTYDCGAEPVAAATAKIIINFILACSIEAMGEGFALGRRYGLPEDSLFDILTDGLFAAPAYKVYGRIIADRSYFDAAGFSATTGLKDITLALAAGADVAMPLPSANVCRDRLMGAIANGHADADWSVMAHEQARAGGLDR